MNKWTPEQDDLVLDRVLPCVTKGKYQRETVMLANELGIGEVHFGQRNVDGTAIRRHLWGLAVRAVEYTPTVGQTTRTGLPWTWLDHQILNWAFVKREVKQTRGKPIPDMPYIALMLRRTVEDIELKRGIKQQGVQGFNVCKNG
jgi:hypothetical protein